MTGAVLSHKRLVLAAVAVICSILSCTPSDNAAERTVLGFIEGAADSSIIELQAWINGRDADTPPGPDIDVGKPITLSLIIHNLDTARITDVVVTDSELGAASCPFTYVNAGSFMTCQIKSTATAGQHASMTHVTAQRADQTPAEASIPVYYFGVSQEPVTCNAGGPYTAECQAGSATIQLNGSVANPPAGATLTYLWTSDCPGAVFDDASSLTPKLTVAASDGCSIACTVTLTVSDGTTVLSTCEADVTVADTLAPVFDVTPENLNLECGNPDNETQADVWLDAITATDGCGTATVTYDLEELPEACSGPVTVTWTAKDVCDHSATVSAEIEVMDTIPPVITLNGEATVTVEWHTGTYTELGASVSDQCDTALTEATVGGDVVDVEAPGTYVVTYDAVDTCGNPAEQVTRTVEVRMDDTPPAITIVQPTASDYPHSGTLTVEYSVTDEGGSGLDSYTVLLDGSTTLAGHGLESGQVIDLLTELALGPHTFTINATDKAGNASSSSVTFTLVVTADSVKQDVNQFLYDGKIKNAGLANSLLANLNAAGKAFAKGDCKTSANIYNAFINAVTAQTGKGIDATAAAIMIADAQYLIDHCP